MSQPACPQKGPYPIAVEASKDYYWCACGLSASQPFCDGSHKESGITPIKYTATESTTAYFCGCKQSKKDALCDGTHSKI